MGGGKEREGETHRDRGHCGLSASLSQGREACYAQNPQCRTGNRKSVQAIIKRFSWQSRRHMFRQTVETGRIEIRVPD
jgi:hypothetical protein